MAKTMYDYFSCIYDALPQKRFAERLEEDRPKDALEELHRMSPGHTLFEIAQRLKVLSEGQAVVLKIYHKVLSSDRDSPVDLEATMEKLQKYEALGSIDELSQLVNQREQFRMFS